YFNGRPTVTHGISNGPVYDLVITVHDTVDKTLRVDFDANPDLYSVAEIAAHHRRFLDFFRDLIDCDLDVPTGRVEVVSPAERARIVGEWNDTGRLVHGGTVHGLFAEQVARTPVAVAVACGDTSLTYAQLDARADRLARLLAGAGVGREDRV